MQQRQIDLQIPKKVTSAKSREEEKNREILEIHNARRLHLIFHVQI